MLQIKRMPVGQIGTNCYLLEDTEAKTCAVIDPGDQPDDIDRDELELFRGRQSAVIKSRFYSVFV